MPNLQTGLLVVFLFLLHGCVVIPLPEKCVSGEEVTPEELAVLQPSLTSKKEIIELLGEPDVFWVDENVFVYNWSMRWAVMPWIVGGPYQAVGGIEEFENDYVLLLQFDKDDRLQRFERIKRALFESYGELLEKWIDQNNGPPCPETQKKSQDD